MQKNMTTEEVAKMLNVTKSTVKRWSDSGKISCIRTVGHHRKFSYSHIVEFAAKQSHRSGPKGNEHISNGDSAVIRDMVRRNELNTFRSVLFASALRGNKPEILDLLILLYNGDLLQKDILMEVVVPVLKKLDRMEGFGTIDTSQGRIAKNSISNAFTSFCDRMVRQSPKNSVVVIFTFEQTLEHQLRILESKFDTSGYLVVNLGLVPSWPAVEQWIARSSSNMMLCIMKHSLNSGTMRSDINALERIAEDRDMLFLCGTLESFAEQDIDLENVRITCRQMEPAVLE
jgi:excisionase family DNA binding protein